MSLAHLKVKFKMSQKELGLAVIGSGRIGSLRAILASGHPAVKYLGVSDINIENAKKLAAKSNAQKFTDDNHELISDPNVNVVIVSTSEHEHFDSVMHALELGKPVLVEKPIALSVDEADKMIKKGFQLVTIMSDQRFISSGSKTAIAKFKKSKSKEEKGY